MIFKIKHSANYWYKHCCNLWKLKCELESHGYFLEADSNINKTMCYVINKYCNLLRGNDG